MTELTQYIPDEGTMLRFGKKLAEVLVKQPQDNAIVLYFNGDLGAGKTTLTRGMVQGLGYQGNVKSPTYTLVEEYSIAGKMIYHFSRNGARFRLPRQCQKPYLYLSGRI